MSDKLIQMQSIMLKNYLNNMKFLKKYDNALYNRVESLSHDLEKGLIAERYSLELDENKLNIIDVHNKEKLYEMDPYYDALYKVSKFYPNIQNAISLITTQRIEKRRDPKYEVDSFDFINEYTYLINKYKIMDNKKFKEIGKYIFIGTLLGIHIDKLHKKIKAKNYLIIENSLEVFRLSLFFCDYKKISKQSQTTFIVEQDDLEYRMILRRFLKNDSKYNHILKYTVGSNKYTNSLQKLSEIIALENPLLYSFSDYLGAYGRGIEYIKNGYKILNFQKINSVFENKPILYLGPGPSLSEKY